MAKHTKEELLEIKRQNEDLFKLILEKTGVSYRSLIEHAKKEFVIGNLDMVTPMEREQFSKLVF